MNRDRITGIVAAVAGLAILLGTMTIADPVAANPSDIGAKAVPALAGLMLLLAGIGSAITAPKSTKSFFTRAQWKALGSVSGLTLLYAIVMTYVGFAVTTAVFLFIMCTLFLRSRKLAVWKRVLYAVVVSGALYGLFTGVLNLRLPAGWLF